jgi:uncharacterized membrane protein
MYDTQILSNILNRVLNDSTENAKYDELQLAILCFSIVVTLTVILVIIVGIGLVIVVVIVIVIIMVIVVVIGKAFSQSAAQVTSGSVVEMSAVVSCFRRTGRERLSKTARERDAYLPMVVCSAFENFPH